jgi:hypothetical protein
LVEKERMVVVRPHTPKHIRSGGSHTDTSEPVDGCGAQTMVRVSNQRPFDHWLKALTTALTGPWVVERGDGRGREGG